MAFLKQAISNIGTKLYMTEVDVEPTAADLISDLVNVTSPGGVITNEVAYNSVTSGWTLHVPTTRDNAEMNIEFACVDVNSFNRVQNKSVNTPTGSNLIYQDFYIVYPKRADWPSSMSIKLRGYLKTYTPGDISADAYQNITFVVQPSGGFEKYLGIIGTVNTVTVAPTTLTSVGGTVTATVTGVDLADGLFVVTFMGDVQTGSSGQTTGTSTNQTTKLVIPSNSTGTDQTYTIKVSLDNGNSWDTHTATLTVSAPTVG